MRCLRCQAALIAMGSKSGLFEYSCQDNVALRHRVTTGAQSATGRWRGRELRLIVSPIASYTKSTGYVMPTRWSNVLQPRRGTLRVCLTLFDKSRSQRGLATVPQTNPACVGMTPAGIREGAPRWRRLAPRIRHG
jgi:hypothetical protein